MLDGRGFSVAPAVPTHRPGLPAPAIAWSSSKASRLQEREAISRHWAACERFTPCRDSPDPRRRLPLHGRLVSSAIRARQQPQQQRPDPPSSPLSSPAAEAHSPIDLATALCLATRIKPQIGTARTPDSCSAPRSNCPPETLLLPSLNSGVSYRGHNGAVQRVRQNGRQLAPVPPIRLRRWSVRVIRHGGGFRGKPLQPTHRRLVQAAGRATALVRQRFGDLGDFL